MFISETNDSKIVSANLKNSTFKKVRRIQLTKLRISQLHGICSQLELDVIEANKKLVSFLIDKDSLFVERDSYLVNIESLRKVSVNNQNQRNIKINSSSSFYSDLKNSNHNNNKINFAKLMKCESDSSDDDETFGYNNTCEEILKKLGKKVFFNLKYLDRFFCMLIKKHIVLQFLNSS